MAGRRAAPGNEVPRLPHSRSTLEFQPLPQDDPRQRRPDITEASERLGCIPAAPQEEGLLRIILRFRQRYFA